MGLARSTFYYRNKNVENSLSEQQLRCRIEAIAAEFPGYGQRRITQQLRREGSIVNHKRVSRIVRQMGLQCRIQKAFTSTTNSKHNMPCYPNLIKDIMPYRPNQIWVADITYIHLVSSFVYLAAILDLFSRKIIGYALSRSLGMSFTIQALQMAINRRDPQMGCIHHSDQGGQYASNEYVHILQERGFKSSMASRGNPYENAVIESFFKTLKYEEVFLNDYKTIYDVAKRIPYFIQEVYNRKRLHSSLGYVSPDEFEASYINPNACQAYA